MPVGWNEGDCEPLAEGFYPLATVSPERVGLRWGGVNSAGCHFILSLILSFSLPPLTQSLNDTLPDDSSATDSPATNTGDVREWGLAPSLAAQKRQILLPPPAAPPLKYLQTSPYFCILPPPFASTNKIDSWCRMQGAHRSTGAAQGFSLSFSHPLFFVCCG